MTTEAPATLWHVREYETEVDASLVASWWKEHGHGEFPIEILPPVGIIVELNGAPVAAGWLYMAVGVGVCWLEHPVGKPGLAPFILSIAFRHLVEAMDRIASTHDYGIMFAHAIEPIAKVMQRLGFTAEGRKKITVARRINHGS